MKQFYTLLLIVVIFFISSPIAAAQEWVTFTNENSPIEDVQEIKDVCVDPISQGIWIAANNFVYRIDVDQSWETYDASVIDGLNTSSCIAAYTKKYLNLSFCPWCSAGISPCVYKTWA